MPKEEWGVKRLCPHCATRFYDLQKNPMTCPSCGAVFDVESLTAPKGRAARAEKSKPEVVVPIVSDTDDEEVVLDDDSSDVEIEDDLLDDDEEDTVDLEEIAEVASDDDD